jgi:hypothetical protein
MANERPELSAFSKTKAPPARTGLAVMPILLKPTLVPDKISEVTGVDDSVVGADGDEAEVAVAYDQLEPEDAEAFMMLPFEYTQISTFVEFAYANKGPRTLK